MTEQLKAAALPMHVFHRDGQDLFTADQMREYAADALRAALAADAVPTEPVAKHGWEHAGHFYNLVAHALMDVGAAHGGCKFRLQSILEELAPLAAAPQPASEPNRVPMPTNEDQAAGMALVGTAWLKEHAPHRLQPASEPQPAPVGVDASDAPPGFVAVAQASIQGACVACVGCHFLDATTICPTKPEADSYPAGLQCRAESRKDGQEVIFVRAEGGEA